MCDGCRQKNLIFEKKVNEAAAELFGTNDIISNFVIVAEGIDGEGTRYNLFATSPEQRNWQSKGLIQEYRDFLLIEEHSTIDEGFEDD